MIREQLTAVIPQDLLGLAINTMRIISLLLLSLMACAEGRTRGRPRSRDRPDDSVRILKGSKSAYVPWRYLFYALATDLANNQDTATDTSSSTSGVLYEKQKKVGEVVSSTTGGVLTTILTIDRNTQIVALSAEGQRLMPIVGATGMYEGCTGGTLEIIEQGNRFLYEVKGCER